MTRLPAVMGEEVVRTLRRVGFELVRVSGSHHRLVHRDNPARATTVPVHGGRTLKRGTVRNIIKQSGFTVEEFVALL